MGTQTRIALKRIYEPATDGDGRRVLVERLWPRGVSKEKARIDLWARDAAPSDSLRRWFDHDPQRWDEFRRRYFSELETNPAALTPLRDALDHGPVTFVFASRETRFNNAVALKEYMEERGPRHGRPA